MVEPLLCLRNDQNGNIVERLLSTLALVFRLLVPSSQPLSRLWREVLRGSPEGEGRWS